jgi:hypothetical protein
MDEPIADAQPEALAGTPCPVKYQQCERFILKIEGRL